ncbi:nitrous oxide reductase accessory protein NosL [Campylobacter fetus]|uniref:Nitrous oxide reductase accessory protein n=3 Tax=Campylobacter fetus TaxID=196 RepID=Q841W4_CAMFE|nr:MULTISPECIES: nitrous oxide reductase accessory protein NosL [Campylobacter]OCS21576.1 hypothetical protein CFVI97532_08995 [Campylobacter fetus subsp. venerealis cfvi97/532]OCS27337.1 hypothetical protein CFVB10_01280 [Campylobacter fetus subsp. venerealis cfvB10]OCS30442.1 hypothetical protein CFVCCUG33900_02825 [Campylobacter fetus subsp. venerealis LMG 6570 = CCUG 33900]OCS41793.1 hypothetical protein CFVI02298_06405 [Campylobacter fetus subsp. venerealis cfvi02/298]AAO64238.1 hypotheti
MRKILFLALFCTFLFGENLKTDPFFKDVNTTCPIKFIDVFNHPDFIAVLVYANGEKILFSSVKPMFHYFHMNPGKHISPLKTMLVTDFKTHALIDAATAYYVFGSGIMSNSGDDLIPFANLDDAKEFMSANHGHKILEFKDVTKKLIDYLN